MNKGIAICLVGLVIVILGGVLLMRKKDNFNITTDPLRMKYDYEHITTDKYPRPHMNRLNDENDKNVDICSFNKKFNSDTTFLENENMDPCALTARQYCSVLYSGHEELFMNRYSGLGECEKMEAENCRSCRPCRPLHIKKQNDIYYTQLNRGV